MGTCRNVAGLKFFCENTTFHGFAELPRPGPLWLKLIWVLGLVSAVVYCAFHIITTGIDYAERPSLTKISFEPLSNHINVSISPSDPFITEKLVEDGITGNVEDDFMRVIGSRMTVLDTMNGVYRRMDNLSLSGRKGLHAVVDQIEAAVAEHYNRRDHVSRFQESLRPANFQDFFLQYVPDHTDALGFPIRATSEQIKIPPPECKQPPYCEEFIYTPMIAPAPFSTSNIVERLMKDACNLCLKLTFVNVEVSPVVREKWRLTFTQVLGSVGGLLGLFIGGSVFSIMQLLYMAVSACISAGTPSRSDIPPADTLNRLS